MLEFVRVLDAHASGFALARYLTEPQEWVHFHMIYTAPADKVNVEKILLNGIEVQAARIEDVICHQTTAPKHNEHLEAISKLD